MPKGYIKDWWRTDLHKPIAKHVEEGTQSDPQCSLDFSHLNKNSDDLEKKEERSSSKHKKQAKGKPARD